VNISKFLTMYYLCDLFRGTVLLNQNILWSNTFLIVLISHHLEYTRNFLICKFRVVSQALNPSVQCSQLLQELSVCL
jgi:hypothetical protein